MAKKPEEIKKNAIGSQNSEAERTGAMLVGRRRSVDPEADSAKLRSLFTLMFISVPIFIGVTTVFVSSLFADPEQSTVGITPNEERLVKEPVTVQTRWQEGIEAIVSKNSSTASACITFEPPLKKDTRIRYEDYVELKPVQSDLVMENRAGKFCVDGLRLAQEYEINLLPGFPGGDLYETDTSDALSIFIPNKKPEISFRERGYVLPRYGAQIIPIDSVNVSQATLKVFQISERNLLNGLSEGFLNALDRWDLRRIKDTHGSLVFEGTVEFDEKKNVNVTSGLEIPELVGSTLEAGVYIAVAGVLKEEKEDWSPETTQWFVVSDIGTSLFQGPDGLHVMTRSLKTGEPLPMISVTLLAKNNRELAQSNSNSAGTVFFPSSLLGGVGGDEPILVQTESAGSGFGFVSLSQSAFDFRDRGVSGRGVPGPIDAFMYTERGIYRPGEHVNLTAIVRDDKGAAFNSDVPLTLRILRPDGVEVDRYVLNDKGGSSYSKKIFIDPSARMGEWNAYLYLNPNDKSLGEVSFQVNDFVPPKIEVKVEGSIAADPKSASFLVDVSADYLFGAPAAGLEMTVFAKIQKQRHPYVNWGNFSFGLQEETFNPIDVNIEFENNSFLDKLGKEKLSGIIKKYPDVTVPLQLDITASVFELGGRPRTKRIALPLNNLEMAIGIKPRFENDRVASDSRAVFDVVALDRSGKTLTAEGLKYRLLKEHRSYTWFRQSGAWDYEVFIRDEEIQTGQLNIPDDDLGEIGFLVPWGAYRLEVINNKTLDMSSYRFSAGWGGSASGPDRPDNLQVVFDQEKYSVGETAKVFVTPPFSGKLVLAVVGRELEFIQAGNITSSGKTVEIDISQRWEGDPGLYIMPIVYRPADRANEQQPGRAIGVKWMDLDVESRALHVAVNTPETVKPGQIIDILLDTDSSQTETFVSVAAVDDGVLNLTGYEPPNPFSYFFAQRDLAYEIRDTYGYLINPYGTQRAIIESGGDSAEGRLDRGLSARSSRVISLFSGIVQTELDGTAKVSFEVPQFSGRLRVMAVAWNKNQIGHADKKILIGDRVVSDLVLPRFLAPGDRALATATFHNTQGVEGNYKIEFSGDGPIEFGGRTSWEINLEPKGEAKISLPIGGTSLGVANIKMKIIGPEAFNLTKNWDLSVRPFQPYTMEKSFKVLQSGERQTLKKTLLGSYIPGTERAMLSIGVIPSFSSRAMVDKLMRYPYRCLEQTTSRGMGFLFGMGEYPSVGSADSFPEDLSKEIQKAISRLNTLQRRDGSFGLWSSTDSSEKWLSVYATDFLMRAKEAGFNVPQRLTKSAMAWLRSNVRNGRHYDDKKISSVAYSHYVLARANQGNIGKMRYFFDNHRNDFPSMIENAFMISAFDSYGDIARSKIAREALMLWTQSAFDSNSVRYDYYSSPLREIAATLHLAAESGIQNERLISLASSFAEHIAGKRYFSTQESAWISMAALSIERWAKRYLVEVNGQEFRGPNSTKINLNSRDLKQGVFVRNMGRDDSTYEVAVVGVKSKALPAASNGFKISREFLDEYGNKIRNQKVKQGSAILVRLSGTVKSGWDYYQAMVIDLLPAGFEIESVKVNDTDSFVSIYGTWEETKKEFVKGRDDRYVAALDLEGDDTFQVQYIARAVTRGTYVLPAPYIENMYRPDQFARGKVTKIEIVQ